MRDNHDGMMEFLDAFEKEDHFFTVVDFRSRRFQFGVWQPGYRTLRKVLQLRPFDMMPGRKYRYFYAGSGKRGGQDNFVMWIRIELDRDATKEEVAIPKDLHANLLWFSRLETIEEAAYLEII
ncbi:MAG: hypothetical protein IPL32_09915 [Chloracidobacterium sp.]|nr:hypothetical protein [Chloracidobacterium sp.]